MGRKKKKQKKRKLNNQPKQPLKTESPADYRARKAWDANHMITASCRLRVSDYFALRDLLSSYGMTVHSYFRLVAGIALLSHGSPVTDGLRKDTLRAVRRRVKALDALQNRSKLMSQNSDNSDKSDKDERDTGPAPESEAFRVVFRYD